MESLESEIRLLNNRVAQIECANDQKLSDLGRRLQALSKSLDCLKREISPDSFRERIGEPLKAGRDRFPARRSCFQSKTDDGFVKRDNDRCTASRTNGCCSPKRHYQSYHHSIENSRDKLREKHSERSPLLHPCPLVRSSTPPSREREVFRAPPPPSVAFAPPRKMSPRPFASFVSSSLRDVEHQENIERDKWTAQRDKFDKFDKQERDLADRRRELLARVRNLTNDVLPNHEHRLSPPLQPSRPFSSPRSSASPPFHRFASPTLPKTVDTVPNTRCVGPHPVYSSYTATNAERKSDTSRRCPLADAVRPTSFPRSSY